MPEQTPEPDTEEIEEEPSQELQDPDDYHRRQRLKQIHKRREQVHKTIDGMDFYTKQDEHNRNQTKLGIVVTTYIAELEPLIDKTEASPELPDGLPWDDVTDFANRNGAYYDDDGNHQTPSYEACTIVFRACNKYLADVKPLIEEDDSDEWEV